RSGRTAGVIDISFDCARCDSVARRAAAGHAGRMDAEQDGDVVFGRADPRRAWQPPRGALPEQRHGLRARVGLRLLAQLLVAPEHDDGRPVVLVPELLDLDADPGVLPQPDDLLPQRREEVEMFAVDVE